MRILTVSVAPSVSEKIKNKNPSGVASLVPRDQGSTRSCFRDGMFRDGTRFPPPCALTRRGPELWDPGDPCDPHKRTDKNHVLCYPPITRTWILCGSNIFCTSTDFHRRPDRKMRTPSSQKKVFADTEFRPVSSRSHRGGQRRRERIEKRIGSRRGLYTWPRSRFPFPFDRTRSEQLTRCRPRGESCPASGFSFGSGTRSSYRVAEATQQVWAI